MLVAEVEVQMEHPLRKEEMVEVEQEVPLQVELELLVQPTLEEVAEVEVLFLELEEMVDQE
jgi:hypothetical protein